MTLERKIDLKGDTERNALLYALSQISGLIEAGAGAVTDDDNAATAGTAVNIVDHGDGFAHLESTLAGEVDTTFEIADGGPTLTVFHAETPAGVQLYVDEDADPVFIANLASAAAVKLVASDGRTIVVGHDATPTGEGVAAYVDDDATNAYEKLLFVSPTDGDAAFATEAGEFVLTLDMEEIKNPTVRPQFEQETDTSITLYLVSLIEE